MMVNVKLGRNTMRKMLFSQWQDGTSYLEIKIIPSSPNRSWTYDLRTPVGGLFLVCFFCLLLATRFWLSRWLLRFVKPLYGINWCSDNKQTIWQTHISFDKYTLSTYKIPNAAYSMAIFRGKEKCSPSKHSTLKFKANGRVNRAIQKYNESEEASKPITTYGNNRNKVWR